MSAGDDRGNVPCHRRWRPSGYGKCENESSVTFHSLSRVVPLLSPKTGRRIPSAHSQHSAPIYVFHQQADPAKSTQIATTTGKTKMMEVCRFLPHATTDMAGPRIVLKRRTRCPPGPPRHLIFVRLLYPCSVRCGFPSRQAQSSKRDPSPCGSEEHNEEVNESEGVEAATEAVTQKQQAVHQSAAEKVIARFAWLRCLVRTSHSRDNPGRFSAVP